jgi:hypothetical protein
MLVGTLEFNSDKVKDNHVNLAQHRQLNYYSLNAIFKSKISTKMYVRRVNLILSCWNNLSFDKCCNNIDLAESNLGVTNSVSPRTEYL